LGGGGGSASNRKAVAPGDPQRPGQIDVVSDRCRVHTGREGWPRQSRDSGRRGPVFLVRPRSHLSGIHEL